MGTRQPTNERTPAAANAPATNGASVFKIAALTTALLVAEAAAIVGLFAFVGRPAATQADVGMANAERETQELPLFEGRLSNDRAGSVYAYDTEIYLQVPRSEAERVRKEIERTRHELRAEIAAIWRSAEPAHFQEPRFETLTARLEAMLRERFNRSGRQGVEKVVVVSGAGLRLGR
ncbi:MAG: hypothetical protein KF724_10690 [Phycisphaeraceae bacterium]|nr:hypothetical protein [Phycisphaeraceae bacterium]